MRVVVVSPYDNGVPGGVQSQVRALAAALARRDCEVVLAAPGVDGAGRGHGGNYEVAALGRSFRVSANGSRAPVAPTPAAVARCLRLLARRRPDVVHVHEPLVPGPSLATAALGPRPIVATFHRAGSDRWYRGEGQLLGGLIRRVSCMVAVSEAARATAVEVLGPSVAAMPIVPNGIELRHPGVDDADRAATEGSGAGELATDEGENGNVPVGNGRPTIVFVGRHEPRKGLEVLLAAVSRLGSPARLVVAGDGPQTPLLRRRYGADRDIEWLGEISDDARAELLAGADLFVAPSLGGESFGVVLLEAMAAGVAVLASDLPGYRLAAGDGGAARFVRPGDPGALSAAIGELLADPGARARLSYAGRLRAEAFSMDAIAERYLELYRAAGAPG